MAKWTVDAVKRAVSSISNKRHDDEMAHQWEDDLYEDLLRAIADGECEEPRVCASEALKTKDIDFARWCA